MIAFSLLLILAGDVSAADDAAITSDTWTTYYSAGGGSSTVDKIKLTAWSASYVASCTSISGTCTSITVNINAYKNSSYTTPLTLSKELQFTRVASSTFKIETEDFVNYAYFKINMSYSDGTSAVTNGAIKLYGY